MKNTPAAGHIHAKTGSVEHVRTLSGFAETPSGRRLIFSFLGNNQGGRNHEAADALAGLCVATLEEFNVAPKRSEEHTSELQSRLHLVCRLLLEKKTNIHLTTSRQSPNEQVYSPHAILA